MTQTTLERTISRMEREISGASDSEKAKAAQRLRALMSPAKAVKYELFEDDDDMFNNMPV